MPALKRAAWTSDYGNPDVEEDFQVLIKYSPLHNVRTPQVRAPASLFSFCPSLSAPFLACVLHMTASCSLRLLLWAWNKPAHTHRHPAALWGQGERFSYVSPVSSCNSTFLFDL